MKCVAKALALSAAILLLMVATAFAGSIKIGLMCPLTGQWASEGQDMRNIVQLLADDLNKAGGLNGSQVELVVEDDGGDPRTAALAAQKLTNSGVTSVIGTYGSSVTEASQNIYADAGIVQVATGSTAVRLSEKGLPLFFRTAPRDDDQGRMAAQVIKAKGFKALALLHDNSSYAKGLADETKALLDKMGVKIVFYDAITPNERDFTAILTKLKAANPDGIFFTGYYTDAGMLLRQKAEMKWNVPMMGGDATNNLDLVKIAGKDSAKGFFFISPPVPQDLGTADAKAFLKSYEGKYKAMPSSIWSVLAGDAFKVITEAIKGSGKTDAKDIAEYLKTKLKNYPGLTGPISFNEKGDRVGDLYSLYKVDANGNYVIQP